MRNFIRFIIRYHFVILFLIFEAFSLYLLTYFSQHHRQTFVNSSNSVFACISEVSGSFTAYFSLKRSNDELARENAYLRTMLPADIIENVPEHFYNEETEGALYLYRPARVVNNSVNRLQNYLTINIGETQGVKPEMGVISARGLVGIVRHVSSNYATVVSLLNNQIRVSAKLRESDFFGSLEWDGKSVQYAILNDIPFHAPLSAGDAVVTSGYSIIFPEGILIGTIEEYIRDEGEGFYKIRVKLSVDFKRLTYVEVIESIMAEEQLQLEKITIDAK